MTLAEKGLPVQLVETFPWEESPALTAANPAREIPVLTDEPPTGGEISISPATAILEYIEEVYASPKLMPATSAGRAETRRLLAWIVDKFDREVIDNLVRERIDKKIQRRGQPDYDRLSAGAKALDWHLDYFDWLLENRNWLAGEALTLADIAGGVLLLNP